VDRKENFKNRSLSIGRATDFLSGIQFADLHWGLDHERTVNYVHCTFLRSKTMIRAVVEEAAAITSVSLFVGMIAVWAHVIAIF
jgi:hypothetical protein